MGLVKMSQISAHMTIIQFDLSQGSPTVLLLPHIWNSKAVLDVFSKTELNEEL